MLKEAGQRWSITDAAELYELPRWGKDYFSISASGNLLVHPDSDPHRSLDLKELVDNLRESGTNLPVLLRFNGILDDRLKRIHDAFANAIAEFEYSGRYSLIYPIKVNPQRQVVERILEAGRRYRCGLEAGSKAELMAVIAMSESSTPIICNGFKDAEFIRLALLSRKMGRQVTPVVEKFSELELIVQLSKQIGVRPAIGMRVKLASPGSGRWQASGGYRSKFGLTVHEVLRGVALLEENDMLDCFQLLHFHLGSQITNIRHAKRALTEAARVYADLIHRGVGLRTLDVGGGLGVDYDGSQTNFASSMNYSLQEYANDVVYYVRQVCEDAGVAHPDIVSESGRAVAAYHSVLVFNVLGVTGPGYEKLSGSLPDDVPPTVSALRDTLEELNSRNFIECFHDAQQAMDTAMNLFSTGHMTLDERCLAETLFWQICRRIQRLVEGLDEPPEELDGLDRLLADIYFCNFSLFRSMPDSWAIKQIFPLMPIHRLGERPSRHAILADITCDSDGKIEHFLNRRDVSRTIQLHPFESPPYHLAAFLTGAYQEILGDLHNLLGDTNVVQVELNGEVFVRESASGHSIRDILELVQFEPTKLVDRVQAAVDDLSAKQMIEASDAAEIVKAFSDGLAGYTYPNACG